jgi:hypothetical protein
MCNLVFRTRTIRGKRYFVNKYIIIIRVIKLNKTWFTKKKGTNCGIFILLVNTIVYVSKCLRYTVEKRLCI